MMQIQTQILLIILTLFVKITHSGLLKDDYQRYEKHYVRSGIILIILEVLLPSFFYCCCSCRRGFWRTYSFCYWFVFWITVPFVLGSSLSSLQYYSQEVDFAHLVALFSLPVTWLVMFLESCACFELKYLGTLEEKEDVEAYVRGKIIVADPGGEGGHAPLPPV